MEYILLIVIVMIGYDLSIHLIYLIGKDKFFLHNRINYWPNWSGHGHAYQIFWSCFWAIALALLMVYAITS